MPIFLDRVVPSHIAILISVTAVLIVGEVVPQAICIGPRQLAIAECTAPLVTCLCYITAPISWPIAKILDALLGEHKLTRFTSTQLEALVQMHCVDVMNKASQMGHHYDVAEAGENREISRIANWRASMIRGALRANASTAHEIEKRIETVYMLSWDAPVDKKLLEVLTQKGFSRIPIYYGE